jgi:hypothetical protein
MVNGLISSWNTLGTARPTKENNLTQKAEIPYYLMSSIRIAMAMIFLTDAHVNSRYCKQPINVCWMNEWMNGEEVIPWKFYHTILRFSCFLQLSCVCLSLYRFWGSSLQKAHTYQSRAWQNSVMALRSCFMGEWMNEYLNTILRSPEHPGCKVLLSYFLSVTVFKVPTTLSTNYPLQHRTQRKCTDNLSNMQVL